ncbi:threonine ammonia-lyase [Spiroplasma endosymbiont of Nebria brevicollis]|uniref:threonine ammonia-lyase n=1 Tax=Spiroplasma endosymbiont of Nebria brevicollis TaxID=3066284 RepID=UPI00313B58FB
MEKLINAESIEKTYEQIKDKVIKTSLIKADKLSSFSGNNVFLKLENLQKTGSFKIRGALNKILNLSKEQQSKGLIAASAGNHAQGVALAARSLNLKSKIIMPITAPLAKIEATKEYGGSKCIVQLHGTMFDDAMSEAIRIEKEEGLTLVHPYDDNFVVNGQGTIGLEIYEQMQALGNDIDYCLVPIGGGGLLSGISTYLKSKNPNIKFIGIEAENVDSFKQALKNGKPFKIQAKSSIADGIAVKQIGELTFKILKNNVDEIVTVSEEEIAQAMLFLLEKCKVVTEGSGAVSVAALLSGKLDKIIGKGKNVVCLISGGNVDITTLGTIINSALISSHRRVPFSVNGKISNNTINEIVDILTKNGASIYKIHSSFDRNKLDISNFSIFVVMDTSDEYQKNKIFNEIRQSNSNFTLLIK